MIIVIGGEKGGTGKTTVATNLAAYRTMHNKKALLIDADKQRSSTAWISTRNITKSNLTIPSVHILGETLDSDIQGFKSLYDDIIVDIGGSDSIELGAAMTVADKMYIPVQASQFDIWTLGLINELVPQVKTVNKLFDGRIIINRASTNPVVDEAQETIEVLSDFENLKVSKCILKDRIAYRKAAKSGLSVFELGKQYQKAIDEMKQL